MNIAVISDLHLGPGDRSDTFGHDDAEFLRFLGRLEQSFDRIVLLGDVWETLTGPNPGNPAAALAAARAAHPEIAARFRLPKYRYVHGNHDLVTALVDRAPERLILQTDGVRILFTHGHQHDVLFRQARWLSELGIWLGGWILRFGLASVYRAFSFLDAMRAGHARDGRRCTFQRWAVHLAEARQCDVIVTGHTHLALRSEHRGALFLNGGSCAEGRYSFASIDTRRGSYAVHNGF